MDKSDKQLIEKLGKVYEPGTVLFREGEVGKRLYVIHEGRVRLSKRIEQTEVIVEVLGPGDFCGELALVTEGPHAVSAMVLEQARLLLVDVRQFEAMLHANSEIALRMVKKLAGRLTQSHFRIANFNLRRPIARLLHQLKWELLSAESESAPLPDDLSEVLNLERGAVRKMINHAVEEGLIEVTENGQFKIKHKRTFDRYLSYLELQDRFDYLD